MEHRLQVTAMYLKMKWIGRSALILILFYCQSICALQERHLIIIRSGEADHNLNQTYNSNLKHTKYKPSHLTEKGCDQMKQTAETLLTHGFDNRNIAAVYVSPLPRAMESALIIAGIGVYPKDKIHIDARLTENQAGDREGLLVTQFIDRGWVVGQHEAKSFGGESNQQVQKRMLAIYDKIEKKYPTGHIIFITHGMPAMELIEGLTKGKVRLQTGQLYIVPLNKRHL